MMFDLSNMPGDEQTSDMVANWTKRSLNDNAVMVLRVPHLLGVEFRLASVTLAGTPTPYLYTPRFGTFQLNGLRAPPAPALVRLLIPTRDMAAWAIGPNLWFRGTIVPYRREEDHRQDDLLARLREQGKLDDEGHA